MLGERVDGVGRFDQDDDLGIRQQAPGQPQTLQLPTGERPTATGHRCVETVGQGVDDVGGAGRCQSLPDPLGIGLACGRQLASDRAGEEPVAVASKQDPLPDLGQRQ